MTNGQPKRNIFRFKHLRVGLQLKSVLVLTFLTVAITIAGGWLYFDSTQSALRNNDYRHATWMGQALALASQQDMLDQQNVALQRLAGDCIRSNNVLYVALLNQKGQVLASASQRSGVTWNAMTAVPASVSRVWQESDRQLMLAMPVVYNKSGAKGEPLVGAIRLVLDTSHTAESLVRVQQRIGIIAAAIVVCALPLGYMLVWRLILQPIGKLAGATRELSAGDYSSRSGLRRNDEIGDLSYAFDTMADQITLAHDQLLHANERLERKVEERTGELQKVNVRLREEMAEKEDFIRAVSHDLNAPVRNIAGMVTMIQMQWGKILPEEVLGRLKRISANAEMETSLISELLELSRIKSRPEKRQVVDVGELLEQVAGIFDHELKTRNIELVVQGGMPRIYAEKNRLRQVFQNLVDNAIKYMNRPRGGRIEIGYCKVDDQHEFRVADNGPGIAPAEHQKIFYVFRRAQDPAVAKVEGRGVGLAVIKTIVSNYEGKAWVQSEVGQGATFFVSLGTACTQLPSEAEQLTEVGAQT